MSLIITKYGIIKFNMHVYHTSFVIIPKSFLNLRLRFVILCIIKGPWNDSLTSYRKELISKITDLISNLVNVTELRVQDRQLIISPDTIHFIATLLDKPPLLGNFYYYYYYNYIPTINTANFTPLLYYQIRPGRFHY